MNQKRIVILVIIAAIIAVILSIILIIKSTPEPEISYTSKNLGISFSYPKEWVVTEGFLPNASFTCNSVTSMLHPAIPCLGSIPSPYIHIAPRMAKDSREGVDITGPNELVHVGGCPLCFMDHPTIDIDGLPVVLSYASYLNGGMTTYNRGNSGAITIPTSMKSQWNQVYVNFEARNSTERDQVLDILQSLYY